MDSSGKVGQEWLVIDNGKYFEFSTVEIFVGASPHRWRRWAYVCSYVKLLGAEPGIVEPLLRRSDKGAVEVQFDTSGERIIGCDPRKTRVDSFPASRIMKCSSEPRS